MTGRTGGGTAQPGARRARLLTVAAITVGLGSTMMLAKPALAGEPAWISWPFTCKIDHGRLRLEPSAEQSHQIVGPTEQRPFRVCRERQNCRTQTIYRFAVVCGEQHVAWADLVTTLAEKGHPKLAVADGRLALVSKPPPRVRTEPQSSQQASGHSTPGGLMSGWCSNQFGGPTQPFLRQACQQAQRILSDLGNQPIHQPPQRAAQAAPPQVIALPKGFAPLRDAGARLLRPLPGSSPVAAALSSAEPTPVLSTTQAAMVVPNLTAPEPNERLGDRTTRLNGQVASAGATNWITNVHLASATVAASSEQAAEHQRRAANAQTFNVMISLAGLLAATFAVVTLRRRQQLVAAYPQSNATLPSSTALACLNARRNVSRDRAAGILNHRFVSWISACRSHARAVFTRHRHRVVTTSRPLAILTPEDHAALNALPAEAQLIITARHQLANRIDHLRQTIAPLVRTAPALHVALARDLMAGERRLAKITIVSLTVPTSIAIEPTAPDRASAAQKLGQTRLQRVTVDLDRLQAIIAGAMTGLTRDSGPRPLPRDLADAYLALGVNSGVSLSTLKKLVDALRVSWHPDLATSDDDRRHRNERITEINVAWDLIVGKRNAD